jgi:hypothetical protein
MKWTVAVAMLGLALAQGTALGDARQLAKGDYIRDGTAILDVGVNATPAAADWNNDGLPDLVVGEFSTGDVARIRVFLNQGTPASPAFNGFFYACLESGTPIGTPRYAS